MLKYQNIHSFKIINSFFKKLQCIFIIFISLLHLLPYLLTLTYLPSFLSFIFFNINQKTSLSFRYIFMNGLQPGVIILRITDSPSY